MVLTPLDDGGSNQIELKNDPNKPPRSDRVIDVIRDEVGNADGLAQQVQPFLLENMLPSQTQTFINDVAYGSCDDGWEKPAPSRFLKHPPRR